VGEIAFQIMTTFAIVVPHKLTRIFVGAYYYESILLCCFELFLWLSVSISDSLVYC